MASVARSGQTQVGLSLTQSGAMVDHHQCVATFYLVYPVYQVYRCE